MENSEQPVPHCLTIGQLKEFLYKLPADGKVYYQRIEDKYFTENNWEAKPMPSEWEGHNDQYIPAFTHVDYKDGNLYITAHY